MLYDDVAGGCVLLFATVVVVAVVADWSAAAVVVLAVTLALPFCLSPGCGGFELNSFWNKPRIAENGPVFGAGADAAAAVVAEATTTTSSTFGADCESVDVGDTVFLTLSTRPLAVSIQPNLEKLFY